MRRVKITRTESDNEGTFGTMLTDSGLSLRSGELPWRNDRPLISCIPAGVYQAKWGKHPRRGWCYEVQNVPDRSAILFHPANFCGARDAGYRTDLEGCISLGVLVGYLSRQKALLASRPAFAKFELDLKEEPFELTIVDRY